MNIESVMCRTSKAPLSDVLREQLFSSSPLRSQLGELRPRGHWDLALGLPEVMPELWSEFW